MSSFQSNENIHKKEDGSHYLVSINKTASNFWDLGKQCRPRSDAAERRIWSGPSLFAYTNFYSK